MKTSHALPFLAFACSFALSPAHAQPDPNQPPKAQNPVNRPAGGRGGNRTPEQQRAAVTDYLRRQLAGANVTDQKQQDAVLLYVTSELEARQKLGESARSLAQATRNAALSDAQVAGILNDYVAAVQDDKTRHQKALDALKPAINVAQFPRLEASLTLLGLWNDAPFFSANPFGGNGRGGKPRNPNANPNPGAGAGAKPDANAPARPAPF